MLCVPKQSEISNDRFLLTQHWLKTTNVHHDVDWTDAIHDPQRERLSRLSKKRENPAEGYESAVACHLGANADCCRSYLDSDITVLSHCQSKQHRDVLEAICTLVALKPVLWLQKSFVVNLTLLRHTHTHSHTHTHTYTHTHTHTHTYTHTARIHDHE